MEMEQGSHEESIEANLAELRQLFGPPPVLSSESRQSYDEIMARLMEGFAPRNIIEQMYIKELADCTWEMVRYTRHKTLTLQRRFQPRLDYQTQRQGVAAQSNDTLAKGPAQQTGVSAATPDDVLDGLVKEIDDILLKPAAELDHVRALEVAIVKLERINKLLNPARARRDNILEQIERYRAGLGQRLRRISDKIIATELAAVATQPKQVAEPLVTPGEQQQCRGLGQKPGRGAGTDSSGS
jgi:hypothetical protein